MSSKVGYLTEVKTGGTPVSITDEPTENLNGDKLFRITDATKRVLSPDHAVTIKDAVTEDVIVPSSINYLEGVVLLSAANANGITVDAYYVPTVKVGGTKEYSLDIAGDVLDDTAFHDATTQNPGYRTKKQGIHDVTVTFSRWDDLVQTLRSAKIAKTKVLIRVNPGGSDLFITGWFVCETLAQSGDIGALEEQSLNYALSGQITTSFSYSYNWSAATLQAMAEADAVANYFFS